MGPFQGPTGALKGPKTAPRWPKISPKWLFMAPNVLTWPQMALKSWLSQSWMSGSWLSVCRIGHSRRLDFLQNYTCCVISKQFHSRNRWKILHLTEIFYTTSGFDGCDKYPVCLLYWLSSFGPFLLLYSHSLFTSPRFSAELTWSCCCRVN